jgi:hypothetical protein
MPARPTTYVGRIALVERLAKSASYRTDPKLTVRELCEALVELSGALLQRAQEQGEGDGATVPTKPTAP